MKTEENTQTEEVKSREENGGPGVTGKKLRPDPAHGVGRPSWHPYRYLATPNGVNSPRERSVHSVIFSSGSIP